MVAMDVKLGSVCEWMDGWMDGQARDRLSRVRVSFIVLATLWGPKIILATSVVVLSV